MLHAGGGKNDMSYGTFLILRIGQAYGGLLDAISISTDVHDFPGYQAVERHTYRSCVKDRLGRSRPKKKKRLNEEHSPIQ